MSDLTVEIVEDSPIAVTFTESNPINVTFGNVVNGTVLPQDYTDRIRILLEFDIARNDKYKELTYVGGDISQIDIWENNTKALKLFTKVITYTTGNITQTVLTDEQNAKTLTKDITYDIQGNIETVTEVYA